MADLIRGDSRTRDEELLMAERDWIAARRQKAFGKDVGTSAPRDLVGLALSGGGIRSATFNLGVLQALERYGVLKHVDYLSTVSGGGYIGACLTWLKHHCPGQFPFGTQRADHGKAGGRILAHLREHGRFLAPGNGRTMWTMVGSVLMTTLVNLAILLPPLLLLLVASRLDWPGAVDLLPPWSGTTGVWLLCVTLLYLACLLLCALSQRLRAGRSRHRDGRRWRPVLALKVMVLVAAVLGLLWAGRELVGRRSVGSWAGLPMGGSWAQVLTPPSHATPPAYWLCLGLAVALFAFYLVGVALYLLAGRCGPVRGRALERCRRAMAFGLRGAVLAAAIGALPRAHDLLADCLSEWSWSGLSLTGVASLVLGRRGGKDKAREKKQDASPQRSLLLSLGLCLVLAGVLLGLYGLALRVASEGELIASAAAVGLSVVVAWLADINHVSHHRFYRDRLREAFLPNGIDRLPDRTSCDADTFRLQDLQVRDSPYPLLCANVVTRDSKEPKHAGRMGASFLFSPRYCGSDATGYAPTGEWLDGSMKLATAAAIAGAAVDPNTLSTASRPLSFLMSLLNVRLGYWAANPNRPVDWGRTRVGGGSYAWAILAEMFGNGLSETSALVHLNDGGHFENLGLYELVRRRCRYILVCDAAADHDFTFFDLGRAVERVRVDFGARVEIDTRPLLYGDDGLSRTPVVHGWITYDDGKRGELLYLTTVMIEDLPEDVNAYRRQHPTFPDEGTADQFFDEPQFEAYRELGYRVAQRTCEGRTWDSLQALFAQRWRAARA